MTTPTTPHARYDKRGRRLPDTGRGCGCRLCEEAKAPRYERRASAAAATTTVGEEQQGRRRVVWSPMQRALARLVRRLAGSPEPGKPELA